MMEFLLAVETSCDDTSIAVLDENGVVLSSVVSSQLAAHAPFGGIVPEIASREHLKNIIPVLDSALKEAGVPIYSITGVASTMGPGLLGSLLVGFSFAKTIAYALNVPFYGVNHIEAHLLSPWIEDRALPFPALVLVVSGGHSHIFYADKEGSYLLVSATRDDAAGEAFDKVGKKLGLPYPQGPLVDKIARNGNPKEYKFTMPRMKKGLDFSFSGLKTSFVNQLEKSGLTPPPYDESGTPQWMADILASFEKAVIDHLLDRIEKLIDIFKVKSLALAGGVAANTLLRKRFVELSQNYGLPCSIPPLKYCTDNAAMIGFNALSRWRSGAPTELETDAFPTAVWKRIEIKESK
jgi:N6-L-threonylcarbamoyladenine synthase